MKGVKIITSLLDRDDGTRKASLWQTLLNTADTEECRFLILMERASFGRIWLIYWSEHRETAENLVTYLHDFVRHVFIEDLAKELYKEEGDKGQIFLLVYPPVVLTVNNYALLLSNLPGEITNLKENLSKSISSKREMGMYEVHGIQHKLTKNQASVPREGLTYTKVAKEIEENPTNHAETAKESAKTEMLDAVKTELNQFVEEKVMMAQENWLFW